MKLRVLMLATVLANSFVVPSVYADTTANVGVSNMYIWRGVDQSQGNAQVSGGLDYTNNAGIYAGIWTSTYGGSTEFDLYAGYGMQVTDALAVDVGAIMYEYPQTNSYGNEPAGLNGNQNDDGQKLADYSELYLGLNVAGVSFTVNQSLQDSEMRYFTLGYGLGNVTATLGANTVAGDTSDEYMHLDLAYAATDEVTLMLTQVVDTNGDTFMEDDLLVNISYVKSFDVK